MRVTLKKQVVLLIILGTVMIMVGACTHPPQVEPSGAMGNLSLEVKRKQEALREFMENNPCGMLELRRPVFNVTASASNYSGMNQPGLFMVPNTTSEAGWYVVNHCVPISKASIDTSRKLRFDSLPVGKYVLLASWKQTVKTMPNLTVDTFNGSTHFMTVHHQEMRGNHAIVVFTIQPQPTQWNQS